LKKANKDFYICVEDFHHSYPNFKLKHNSYYNCNLHFSKSCHNTYDGLNVLKLKVFNLTEIEIENNNITLKSKRSTSEIYFPNDIQNVISSYIGHIYPKTIILKDIKVKLKCNTYNDITEFYIDDDIIKYKKFIDFANYNNMMVDKLFDSELTRECYYVFVKQKNGRYIIKCNKINKYYKNCRDYIIDLIFYQKRNFCKDYQAVNDNTPYIENTNIIYTWPCVTMKKAILSTKVDGREEINYKDL